MRYRNKFLKIVIFKKLIQQKNRFGIGFYYKNNQNKNK